MPTVRIPIDLRSPRITSLAGNSFYNVVNLVTADIDQGLWQFVKDVQGKIYGLVSVPNTIATVPNAKIILVIAANATVGVTSLKVSTKAIADGESINQVLDAEATQDIPVPGTAFFLKVVTFALTIAGAPSAGDIIIVEAFHDGTKTEDTLAVDTLLIEGYLEIDV